MELKRFPLILWVLMIPEIFIAWFIRGLVIESLVKHEFIVVFGLVIMTMGMYWMIAFFVWIGLICERGRKKSVKRLAEEHFHYDYCLEGTGLAYGLWINEQKREVAVWNRNEPFALHKVPSRSITEVEVVDKGGDAILTSLTLKMNIDGSPIKWLLFNAGNHMVLRTSKKAAEPLRQAHDVCASLERAGAAFSNGERF